MVHFPKTRRPLLAASFMLAVAAGATVAYAVTLRSAQERGVVTALVLPATRIQPGSNLGFRAAAPGAKREIISARGRNRQKINIVGTRDQAYTVFLPTEVRLVPAGAPDNAAGVRVTNFTSYPEIGSGFLGEHGQLENGLGATRNELALDLPSGSYEGVYTLTIAFP